jgi:hypothetical protein
MTSRSVIAKPRHAGDASFEGVYLHNGGGPSELGPILWHLMHARHRLCVHALWRELILENLAGWSSIDYFHPALGNQWDGRTKVTVEQHQENFRLGRQDPGPTSYQGDRRREHPGLAAPPIRDDDDPSGAELIYVVAADALRILARDVDDYVQVARVAWSERQPDWSQLDEQVARELLGRHAQRAVEADGLAVEVPVLDEVGDQECKIVRVA